METTIKDYKKVQKCIEINLEKLGETNQMNCGEIAFIVEYNNTNDITIQFQRTGELVNCQYRQFKHGEVKSHFTPSIYGVGIVGLENTTDANGKQLGSHACWKSILQRCYSDKFQLKWHTYIGCSVCDEWLTYSNFKTWYNDNFYKVEEFKTEIDKDILIKGNKIYSPQTCVFVPNNINSLFIKSNIKRGLLPIGVDFNKYHNKYRAQCNIGNQQRFIGYYETMDDAFIAYKKYKEKFIKDTANKYKKQISLRLYESMMSYEVEYND
jgi:hypothetical protein